MATQTLDDGQAAPRKGSMPLKFSFSRRAEAMWNRSHGSGIEIRDLDTHGASGGVLRAQHIRAADGRPGNRTGWHSDDMDFHFLQVLRGTLRLRTLAGDKIELSYLDTAFQPPFAFSPDIFEFSGDFEALEIIGVGAFAHIEAMYPQFRGPIARDPDHPVVSYNRPRNYTPGDGPRSFFRYRDTGARAATAGRMHIHVVGPVVGGGGKGDRTGWHHHSMDQFYMVVTGTAQNNLVACGGQVDLEFADSMTIPAFMSHNFGNYSEGYEALEVCIPAEYETNDDAGHRGETA